MYTPYNHLATIMHAWKSLLHLQTFQKTTVKNYNETVSRTKKVVKTVDEETYDDAAI